MAPFLTDLLEKAKKGGKDLKKEEKTPEPANPPAAPVPAELIANLGNILNTINQTQRAPDRSAQELLRPATAPIDINSSPNLSGEPVLYQPRTSYVTRVPGIPYAVSDVDHTFQSCKSGRPCNRHDEVERYCDRCVRASPCKRHIHPEVQKTSVSLCDHNHCRMRIFWDLAHIDDSNTVLGLDISNKKDKYGVRHECPRLCTEKYRDKEGNAMKENYCKVYNMDERIKLLVSRTIQDYNDEQEKLQEKIKNRPYIDLRGRKYHEYAGPGRWGRKNPSTPALGTSTRPSHEYRIDGGRLEMEIRVLLQAWHRKKGETETEGTLRKHMRQAWENKMAAQKAEKEMKDKNEKSVKTMPIVRVGLSGGILETGTEKADGGVEDVSGAPVGKKRGTKETKKTIQKRPMSRPVVEHCDEDEEEKVEPLRETKTTKGSTQKRQAVDKSNDEEVMPPKKAKTHDPVPEDSDTSRPTGLPISGTASPKHTEVELGIFEQLLDGVTDAETTSNKKPEEVTGTSEIEPIAKQSRTTATPYTPTVEESELLQRIKQAAGDELHSEEEGETIEDGEEEVPEQEPESPKVAEQTTTPPTPFPKLTSTKRKTPPSAATQAPSKKSKYRSSATITDSDDEADYTPPVAPTLELPEQREGWELTESVSKTSLEVVQTDDVSSAKKDVVVEQGSTIVMKV
jgi:hypothetical protein